MTYRQCSSCGGFCKKSGCERANVKKALNLTDLIVRNELAKPESEPVHAELKLLVRDFFDKYLDIVEESDGGRQFHPVRISCARVMKTEPLSKLLERMRELSH